MKNLVIIGAGASGVFCAATLGRVRDLKVTVLESASEPLQKLLLTGGGRCNFTNVNIDKCKPQDFYPRGASFLRKPLRRFSAKSATIFFEEIGVESKREDDGKLFPASDKSSTVADALVRTALANGASIITSARVGAIAKDGDRFKVSYINSARENTSIFADFVLVSVGGACSTDLKKSLELMGLEFEPDTASLYSLKLDVAGDHAWRALAGCSVQDAMLTTLLNGDSAADGCTDKKRRDNGEVQSRGALLITHFGIGGPAVLKFSSFGARHFAALGNRFDLSVNFIAGFDETARANAFKSARDSSPRKMVKNVPLFGLARNLWEFAFDKVTTDSQKTWANFSAADQKSMLKILTDFRVQCVGKSNHKDEFVTCGGVNLEQVSSDTMESKIVPNLYFAGECLDIDGITGGFNLQAAWTTAFVCAESVRKKMF